MQITPAPDSGHFHITEDYMDKKNEGRKAALDTVSRKAAQIASLFALLAHTSADDELMPTHRETACWLGGELAASITEAASTKN